MQKKASKILIIVFLLIFILQLASLVFLLLAPQASQAAGVEFSPQVKIPGLDYGTVQPDGSTKAIGNYIVAIYKYAIGIVGILAAVVLMWGGVIWLTAGGNAERIGNAKSWITASLSGLVLALASFMILNMVNPDLVKFKIRAITEVGRYAACCDSSVGWVSAIPKTENNKINYNCPSGSSKCDKNCVNAPGITNGYECKADSGIVCCYYGLGDAGGYCSNKTKKEDCGDGTPFIGKICSNNTCGGLIKPKTGCCLDSGPKNCTESNSGQCSNLIVGELCNNISQCAGEKGCCYYTTGFLSAGCSVGQHTKTACESFNNGKWSKDGTCSNPLIKENSCN